MNDPLYRGMLFDPYSCCLSLTTSDDRPFLLSTCRRISPASKTPSARCWPSGSWGQSAWRTRSGPSVTTWWVAVSCRPWCAGHYGESGIHCWSGSTIWINSPNISSHKVVATTDYSNPVVEKSTCIYQNYLLYWLIYRIAPNKAFVTRTLRKFRCFMKWSFMVWH